MMKKARGGDRFDMDSESLMPPALRYVYHILSYFVLFKNEVLGGGIVIKNVIYWGEQNLPTRSEFGRYFFQLLACYTTAFAWSYLFLSIRFLPKFMPRIHQFPWCSCTVLLPLHDRLCLRFRPLCSPAVCIMNVSMRLCLPVFSSLSVVSLQWAWLVPQCRLPYAPLNCFWAITSNPVCRIRWLQLLTRLLFFLLCNSMLQ